MKICTFHELAGANLVVDQIYEGGEKIGDPISKLIPGVGVQGGFRISGRGPKKNLVVLFTTGTHPDWPDHLDLATGRFTYFGDNRKPGHELHDTKPKGNKLLRDVFHILHSSPTKREGIPPFLIFSSHPTDTSQRSVQFRGLAVPGFQGLTSREDLVAIWKSSESSRFQNYRAIFTILDAPEIERAWLMDLVNGKSTSSNAPKVWRQWIETGEYRALEAPPTLTIRTPEEQVPQAEPHKSILKTVFNHFKKSPFGFESFAAYIFRLVDGRVRIDQITRGTVDGGRDAIGRYFLGRESDPIYAEFALEAKCYRPPLGGETANTVGVKEISRLISRLRHRQFGVLVTTSLVARQAYSEIREDGHPIVILSGNDLAEILIENGFSSRERVQSLLDREFPVIG